jgi:hypothetical protein
MIEKYAGPGGMSTVSRACAPHNQFWYDKQKGPATITGPFAHSGETMSHVSLPGNMQGNLQSATTGKSYALVNGIFGCLPAISTPSISRYIC